MVKKIFSALLCCFLCNANYLIKEIEVYKNRLHISINEEFKKTYLTNNFFAEYESDINLEVFNYSVLSMPFIMNVISIVWISGETYCVKEMDAQLYSSLKRVKKVLECMYPNTSWKGKLYADKLVDHHFNDDQQKTALLFSGGIDSTSTALAHLDKKQLLITAWGHWDLPLHEQRLWKTRKRKIDAFAHHYGNETSCIRSNYTSFLNWQYLSSLTPEIKKWRLGAVEGLGWAGLTAPILLTKGYNTLRIASSHTWAYPYPAAANPYIDNNLKLCGLTIKHDQFYMTRLEKIKFICKSGTKPFLKICSLEKRLDANCGSCRKCLSSAIGFYALGKDPQAFGINISLTEALKKTKELLAPKKLNLYTILYFDEVKATIQHRLRQGKRVDKGLEELLALDLSTKKTFDVKNQQPLDWERLHELFPTIKNEMEK